MRWTGRGIRVGDERRRFRGGDVFPMEYRGIGAHAGIRTQDLIHFIQRPGCFREDSSKAIENQNVIPSL